jgi:hypothetical protein
MKRKRASDRKLPGDAPPAPATPGDGRIGQMTLGSERERTSAGATLGFGRTKAASGYGLWFPMAAIGGAPLGASQWERVHCSFPREAGTGFSVVETRSGGEGGGA